jgi:hypothetical protein
VASDEILTRQEQIASIFGLGMGTFFDAIRSEVHRVSLRELGNVEEVVGHHSSPSESASQRIGEDAE